MYTQRHTDTQHLPVITNLTSKMTELESLSCVSLFERPRNNKTGHRWMLKHCSAALFALARVWSLKSINYIILCTLSTFIIYCGTLFLSAPLSSFISHIFFTEFTFNHPFLPFFFLWPTCGSCSVYSAFLHHSKRWGKKTLRRLYTSPVSFFFFLKKRMTHKRLLAADSA